MVAALLNGKPQSIYPLHGFTRISTKVNLYANTATRVHRQTANLTEPTSPRHSRLKPAALALGYVSEEADGVEQVGLARRIGPDDERTVAHRDVNIGEVTPVGQFQAGDYHRRPPRDGSVATVPTIILTPRLPLLFQQGV